MTDNLNPFKNVKEVFKYLKIIYVNLYHELNAREEYRTLIMSKFNFHDFHIKFYQLITQVMILIIS